jgi:hypothetical protein
MDASHIQRDAKNLFLANSTIQSEIASHKHNLEQLFEYFIKHVMQNNYLIVSYILNYCFESAVDRAAFGNKQDAQGNTAYHYAALYNFSNILTIVNDKRAFNGKKVLF